MKKYALVVALLATVFVGSACAVESPEPEASPGPRCRNASWSATRYSYYGDRKTILEKLHEIPANLSNRRVFLQVTKGDSSATVRLYVQDEKGTYTVTQWKTKKTSHLLAAIDDAITNNQGVNCVGDQVIDLLKKDKDLQNPESTTGVSAPATAPAAFSHSIKEASGKFITTTVFVLC